jgi:tetratricopeptide (TPR) repeat protein
MLLAFSGLALSAAGQAHARSFRGFQFDEFARQFLHSDIANTSADQWRRRHLSSQTGPDERLIRIQASGQLRPRKRELKPPRHPVTGVDIPQSQPGDASAREQALTIDPASVAEAKVLRPSPPSPRGDALMASDKPLPASAEVDLLALAPHIATTWYRRDDFLRDLAIRRDQLVAARGGERIDALCDYAEFNIAHMLIAEAKGLIAEARALPGGDIGYRGARVKSLGIVAEILDPSPGIADLGSLPDEWQDAKLWAVAYEELHGRPQPPERIKSALYAALEQSEAITATLIPLFHDAALRVSDAQLADLVIDVGIMNPHLAETGEFELMLGQQRQRRGEIRNAYEHYRIAAAGSDRAAARARIAMAEVAEISDNFELHRPAINFIRSGLGAWGGDELALQARAKLAELAEDLGDMPLALDAMARILNEFPDTPEAHLARERAAIILNEMARQAIKGEISANDFLVVMRGAEPFYRLDPAWVPTRMALAKVLDRNGLGIAALAEYDALWMDIKDAGRLGEVDYTFDELALDHADLLARLNRRKEIPLALSKRGEPNNPSLRSRYMLLKLAGWTSGPLPALGALMFESPEDPQAHISAVLLEYARAAIRVGDDLAAAKSFAVLASRGDVQLSRSDILSATRVLAGRGYSTEATQMAARLDNQDPGAHAKLAESIGRAVPDLSALEHSNAEAILDLAKATYDSAKISGSEDPSTSVQR